MGITVSTVNAAIVAAAQAARRAEVELNAADARMGDGDTGVTVRRVFEALEAARPGGEDLGQAFAELAKVCSGATGSSLGTLVTVAMMTLAKPLKGQVDLPWAELPALLADVRDRMLARGGARLGDKTMVDMLDAVIRATDGLDAPEAMAIAALRAADETLEDFRDRPNRIGRARMFADRTVGMDDPGMLAFHRLLRAVTGAEVPHA
ncbi:DAK2 domain-containing protein [Salipiger mucosus]|uniref:Dak phosphatase n=1 Tax=Salipiger mucosus DSM 16094 TaxID=1123237 RepID=S9S516_9RHOB|nr:DAK2 domain-containing protein [Salipiger mucosus]EPX85280.1 Dak phosphatase [Salipiger mucosus DSM 16094]